MPGQPDAPLGQHLFPAAPGADARRSLIQPHFSSWRVRRENFGIQRMRVGEKSFFAVQDGRVGRAGVIRY